MSDSDEELLSTYRTAPMKFPLHIVDEDGEALCGNLAAKQERFIENQGLDILPTVAEKRDEEDWRFFLADLCGNCRRSLFTKLESDDLQNAWEERQKKIEEMKSEVPA